MRAFRLRLNGPASKSFLIVHTMDINVNMNRKRFRCSAVDTANVNMNRTRSTFEGSSSVLRV